MQTNTRPLPPAFLKLTTKADASYADDTTDAYQPLIGIWLIEMAMNLDWNDSGRALAEPNFQRLTGIKSLYLLDEDGDPDFSKKISSATFNRLLRTRLATLRKKPIDGTLPLFTNIAMLGRILGLSDAEQAILAFAASLHGFNDFYRVCHSSRGAVTTRRLSALIAQLTGHATDAIRAALREDGLLVASGLISIEQDPADIESKIGCSHAGLLLHPHADEEHLAARYLRRAGKAALTPESFPHLALDIDVLRDYLCSAQQGGEPGNNVLFYGSPGTGKTELAKALATSMGLDLYEVPFSDNDGDPIDGQKRLREYNLCQKLLARQTNALLMFDEVEDVFDKKGGGMLFFANVSKAGKSGKAWINRTLERNLRPTIWITNDPDIDPAYLRRFDYSVRFNVPPQRVRIEIARHHLTQFAPDDDWLARIAANEQTTAGQIERAAKVARLASADDPIRARRLVDQTLERSATLLEQRVLPARNVLRTGYDLRFVNADADINRLVNGLRQRPQGTFCFYGAAGTGKSELARYMADEIGRPSLVRRASDILSMWVGEAEKNIAAMFAEARRDNAVLILDEADSFLADRRNAQRSWGVTQVNELLTQMEAFDGVFVCTTNLMDKLDQASLRRFAFKVRFDFLNSDQRWAMFSQELVRLGGDIDNGLEHAVRRLNNLTPGDFAVAARQFQLWGSSVSAGGLCDALRKECTAKEGGARPIGFTS